MLKWALYLLGIGLAAASLTVALSDTSDLAAIGACVLSLLTIASVAASRKRRRLRNALLLVWMVVTPLSLIAAAWGPGEQIARMLLAASAASGLLVAVWSINRRRRAPMMEGYISY